MESYTDLDFWARTPPSVGFAFENAFQLLLRTIFLTDFEGVILIFIFLFLFTGRILGPHDLLSNLV